MIDYAALYRNLRDSDAAAERDLIAPGQRPPVDDWARLWRRQHGLSPLAFQEMLWRVRAAAHINDVLRAAGTIHLGLTLVRLLSDHGIATIAIDGALTWVHPLFPVVAPRHSQLAEDIATWLAELRPDTRLGQLQASLESSARRVDAMLRDLPAVGRSVLFLGDDDLTALLLANAMVGAVTVIDVDPRVLDLFARVKREYGLDLTAQAHDVRVPLPEELCGRFDSVHCDPVDEGPWLEAWLRAAVGALVPHAGARLFLSISPRRLGIRYLGVHRFLLEQGFVLERRVQDLNMYPVAVSEDSFYRTHLTRIADEPWRASIAGEIHTDLLVFRREAAAAHLWPQDYRELRRGV